MKLRMEVVSASDWVKDFSESVHAIVFEADRPAEWDRISYALLFIDVEKDTPCGYVTVQENSAKLAYMQFGGVWPEYRGSPATWQGYCDAIKFLKTNYEVISTKIENVNLPMLKMAMKAGFIIVGASTIKNKVMLEHVIDQGGA